MNLTEKQAEIFFIKTTNLNLLTTKELKQINKIIVNSKGFERQKNKAIDSLGKFMELNK